MNIEDISQNINSNMSRLYEASAILRLMQFDDSQAGADLMCASSAVERIIESVNASLDEMRVKIDSV